jgi:lipopolysaccharide/colanic/teichoic acid biosynthesis glycosyltransferase
MWQISDRNECDFKDRAIHDGRYFEEMSAKTDISVLFSTIGVVVRCTGY